MYFFHISTETNLSSEYIIAYFKNHEPVTYTMSVFELLKTDKDVTTIIDSETGEILFTR